MPRDDPLETETTEPQEEDIEEIMEDIEKLPIDQDPRAGDISVDVQSWDNRINQYQAAAEELGIDPDLVYEPANGGDISTAKAFPNAETLYAEISEPAAEAVNQEGYNVLLGDAEKITLEEDPDLVVFRNSAMDETQTLEQNQPDYVFANNWLGSATKLIQETEEYELTARIPQNQTELHDAEEIQATDTPDDLYIFERTE